MQDLDIHSKANTFRPCIIETGYVMLSRPSISKLETGFMKDFSPTDDNTAIEAAAFRRLLQHLDNHKEVQNIDLMILADFCRNCLAKWYMAAAKEQGINMDYDQAREIVYGMPYSEWKDKYQLEASPEQLAAFEARGKKKA